MGFRFFTQFRGIAVGWVLMMGVSIPASAGDGVEQVEGIFPHQRSDLPKKKNATAGKFIYLGVAPKFEPEDLQLVSSKVGLTLRVTARVSRELKEQYALILYRRFKRIADAFSLDPKLSFHSLQTFETLQDRAKASNTKLWLKINEPNSKHVLEGQGVQIEKQDLSQDEYKKNILTALLRFYFHRQDLSLDSIPELDRSMQDPAFVARLSADLFGVHLLGRFTSEPTQDPKTGKFYLGFLTYVYPIAATSEGPFDQPREAVREFGLEGNIESRIWSDKWEDEFGGMPFLLVEWSGVAFHGPITNFKPLDLWYLRRDFVSHGCHRMDSSDILELRALMPINLSKLQKIRKPIQHITLNWPDVTDWNRDGQMEVMDVQYYEVPTWLPAVKKGADLEVLAKDWLGDAAVSKWRKKHYVRFNHHPDAQKTPVYDPETQLYSGLPRYEVVKNKLVRKGVHGALPVQAFPFQRTRMIQYDDGRPMPKGFDNRSGQYSPHYFLAD